MVAIFCLNPVVLTTLVTLLVNRPVPLLQYKETSTIQTVQALYNAGPICYVSIW